MPSARMPSLTPPPLPTTITAPVPICEVARLAGLRWETVRTLIVEHGIPTQRVATATVVEPGDWTRLRQIVVRYQKAKTKRDRRHAQPA